MNRWTGSLLLFQDGMNQSDELGELKRLGDEIGILTDISVFVQGLIAVPWHEKELQLRVLFQQFLAHLHTVHAWQHDIWNINPASKYMTRVETQAAYLIGLELK